MPTQAEKLAALEERQKGHEEKVKMELANLSTRMDGIEGKQADTHEVLVGMGETLNAIKSGIESKKAVEDALNGDRRKRKMDLNGWLVVLIAGLSMITQVVPLFQPKNPTPMQLTASPPESGATRFVR